jgi:osmotically-inducible protein OsmY
MGPHRATRRSAACHPAAITAHRDQALRHELERLLAEGLDDASEIAISVAGGCVLLEGRVSCSLVKLLAEDLVFALPEIRECDNALVVRRPNDGGSLAA